MQLLMSIAALLAANTASDVSSLSWLSGAWLQKASEGRWAEEYWTPPRGHIMIGAGLTGRGSYCLNGKQLIATVSRIDGSGAESWTYDRSN